MLIPIDDFRQKQIFWWFVKPLEQKTVIEFSGEDFIPQFKSHKPYDIKSVLNIIPQEDRAPLVKEFDESIEKRCSFYREIEFKGQPDFSLVKIILSAVHHFSGDIYQGSTGVGIRKDPVESEIKQMKQQLDMFRIIINYLPVGIWAKDCLHENRYCLWNTMAKELSGFSAEQVLGKTDEEIFPDTVAEGHRESDYQILHQREDIISPQLFKPAGDPDKEQYNLIVKKVVYNEKAEPVFLLGIASDVTEKVQMDRALVKSKEEAEKSSKLKTFFMANLSHEIRTPLNSIVGFSRLLTRSDDLTGDERNLYRTIIEKNSDTLLHLIEDMIDLSRIEAQELNFRREEVSINIMISELFALFKPSFDEKKLEFLKNLDPENTIIVGDEARLKQVFSSLLNNARKFTEKGTVSFGFSKMLPGQIEFFVTDTGIGIPAERIDMIFEQFRQGDEGYTRRFGGMGMGLTIAQKITELLGGTMFVDSSAGSGSTFYFRVPTVFSG